MPKQKTIKNKKKQQNSLNILFGNRKKQWEGGDFMKMERFAEALRTLGHNVKIITLDDKIDFKSWDILHSFNLNYPWSFRFMLRAKRAKIPFVLSTIHFNIDEHLDKEQQAQVVDISDLLILFSRLEKRAIEKYLNIDKIPNSKIHYLINGVSENFESQKPWEEREIDVLNVVNETHPRKNLVNLARVINKLNLKGMIIGPTGRCVKCEEEEQKIKSAGGKNLVRINRYVTHDELVKYYNNAKVVCCPSSEDPFPNPVYEGLNCGCNIVVSRRSYVNIEQQWLEKRIENNREVSSIKRLGALYYCDISEESIEWKLKEALKEQGDRFPLPTWEQQAKELLRCYYKLL